MRPVSEEAWMELGVCRGCDPDLFFPERGKTSSHAKAICAGCVVREECLEYALTNVVKHGVWGGLSERERRRLRGRRSSVERRRATATHCAGGHRWEETAVTRLERGVLLRRCIECEREHTRRSRERRSAS